MADAAPAKERPRQNEAADSTPKGRGKFKLIGIVGAIMLVEGAGIFIATRFLSTPQTAQATVPGLEAQSGPAEPNDREIVIAEFRAMNDRSGHTIVYDLKVYGRVAGGNIDKVQKLLETKKATVEDRFAKVIRAAEPQYFKEAGLETLRRQIKHELDGLTGDPQLVQEVLIPSLMWYNSDG